MTELDLTEVEQGESKVINLYLSTMIFCCQIHRALIYVCSETFKRFKILIGGCR